MNRKKSAREKLCIDRKPEIKPIPASKHREWGIGTFLVPTPLQVDAMIREIPKGEVRTFGALRKELARRSGADISCPLCSGIFWRLTAEAAEEDRLEGVQDITPYWRVVRDDGTLNDRLPGGTSHHASLLTAEGIRISPKGNSKLCVADLKTNASLWPTTHDHLVT
ncbi:MAG: MGMT family protein [Armatimonadetes bacterium]|nr:MGMT family protein [Armatimonadota bacterium]